MTTLISEKNRIGIVDALRGFALFGIIMAHMGNQYYGDRPPPGHENLFIKTGLDNLLQNILDIFIAGKFYTIFSFLFGWSFGIQMLNAQAKNKPFTGRFAWRLTILFLFGLLNQMHYRGDILVIYATLGFFLLVFYKAGDKVLLAWSFIFIFNIPGFFFKTANYIYTVNKQPVAQIQPPGLQTGIDIKKIGEEATAYYRMAKKDDYTAIVKTNITKEFKNKIISQLILGRLFVTMGLLLFGLYVAKKRIFEHIHFHLEGIKKWLWISLGVAITIVVLYAILRNPHFSSDGFVILLASFLKDAFSPALSMVYVACFILLFQQTKMHGLLSHLKPLGRMGLTTYLVQTTIGVLLFFGFGLNLLGVIGNSSVFLIGIIIFTSQIFFSKWWMKHYKYGPFEWLWRSLTYFKAQPMRKKTSVLKKPSGSYEPPA